MIKKQIKNLIYSIMVFLFFSCNNFSSNQKPNNLIDEEIMEKILFEAIMMDVMNTFSEKNPDFLRLFGVNYFYQKYGIDSIQLIQSDKYYSKNPRIYSRIYKKVLDKMQMQKDSIDRLIDTK